MFDVTRPKWLFLGSSLLFILLILALVPSQARAQAEHVYLPLAVASPAITNCHIPNQSYASMPVTSQPISPPPSQNPDVNMGLRGYEHTTALLELVEIGPLVDPKAPQFPALFADNRVPDFSNAYQRYRWDWACDCITDTHSRWETTVLGMAVTPGEIIHVPDSGYDIGGGYEVMVLYAAPMRVTLHIGNSDRLDGYVMHIEDVCTDPTLLALYNSLNDDGRDQLPVLRGKQPFGRALGNEIKIAVRDSGHFLDPRSRNNWWQGR